MAITVKDIQEKEFGFQNKDGYDVEQVDDFLDEIAEQMAALVRENLELSKQVTALEADVEAAKAAALEAEKKTPDYNEKGYFDQLQKSMREAMIGAQRIADQARSEAESDAERIRSEAQQAADATLSKAQAEADKITGGAQGKLEALTQQYDALKAAAQAFKADFASLVEASTSVLKDKTDLI